MEEETTTTMNKKYTFIKNEKGNTIGWVKKLASGWFFPVRFGWPLSGPQQPTFEAARRIVESIV